jgi:hypothetical protein
MKKHYRKENDCLNCGADLQGRFCHNCGQENLEMKESFGHMMRHAISDYFHFDDQFFHTLKPLLFKPGKLTVEYNAGHRAAYLHPVKMYIFISVVYFLLLFQTNFEPVKIQDPGDVKATKEEMIKANKEIDSDLKSPYIPAAAKTAMRKQQAYNNKVIGRFISVDTANAEKAITEKSGNDSTVFTVDIKKYPNYQTYTAAQDKLPEQKRDGLFRRMFTKNMIYYHQKYGEQARDMITENFNHTIPKMMFLILPLFALILKIAFWRDKKFYVEHMIYSIHLHCFVFILFSFLMLLQVSLPQNAAIMQWLMLLGTLYIIWYEYKSLRVVYHRSPFRTITKMIGIDISYLVAFVICMCIAVFITIMFRPMPSE